ncbi:hypothetical protein [Mycobacterium phage Weirdo19]|uniref:Uncharacterized protein n=1 Tax=Mycobacterium phage Weirdo19 TaxID=2601610 RepID=A0A6M2YSV1_9CAUD|nr:hypothetical protein KDJ11_gp33 [Mycobacterium phage Weirdo19]QEA10801.1 hypothetical protein [Mycobacterium phage Weirdo19]
MGAGPRRVGARWQAHSEATMIAATPSVERATVPRMSAASSPRVQTSHTAAAVMVPG